ncbi:DNA polymerase V family and Armadillo-type fold domain-containing protein [Strongyloides ratti]|uniref:DNA polymerase V family and Armadillo-type fold domain-containing protein n=1 Tax=Strongyloides ratti TaxID=34506 RepID=A0A090LB56_STRRB|nr:DNA polymerase V family and Armadillo-type fold domain-containing protein [Strongyloides ratti]CEF64720.1 DNA polymerase V family and Armadillo-type fold domain-containing protein [Strongyloides ratti]
MRPPTEILDNFYLLAEYDSEKRIEAIDSIINHSEILKHKKYVVERCIEGLTSSRACVRIGYSGLLTEMLKKYSNDYALFSLEQIIVEKIDSQHNCVTIHSLDVAKVLLYSALVKCGKYSDGDNIKHIIEKLMEIVQRSPLLKVYVYEVIAGIVTNMNSDQFSKNYWNMLKGDGITIEVIWLLSRLPTAHRKILSKNCNYIGNKGEFKFSEKHYVELINALRDCDLAWRVKFIDILTRIPKVYENVIEPFANTGKEDYLKKLDRYSMCIPIALKHENIPISKIFSESFISVVFNLCKFSGVTKRLVTPIVHDLIKQIYDNIEARNCNTSELIEIIKMCRKISKGNFDSMIGQGNFNFEESLLKKLPFDNLIEMYKEDSSLLKKISHSIINSNDKNVIKKLVTFLIENKDNIDNKVLENIVADIISSFFAIKKQDNQISKVEIKDDMKDIVKEFYKLISSDKIKSPNESFVITVKLLLIILSFSSNIDEKESLSKIISELRHLEGTAFDSEQLLDIILALLSRESKVFKNIVYYFFTNMAGDFNEAEFEFLISTIGQKNSNLLGNANNEEMEDIEDEEEEDDEKEDDCSDIEEENLSDEEESGDEEVDPNLKSALEVALGKALSNENVDDEMELDDDAMLELDKAISAVFKQHITSRKEIKKQLNRQSVVFKGRVIQLLEILTSTCLSNDKHVVLINTLNSFVASVQSLSSEESSIELVTILEKIIDRIIENCKKLTISNDIIVEVRQELFSFASNIHSVQGKRVCDKVSNFYINLARNIGEDNSSNEIVEQVKQCFENKEKPDTLIIPLAPIKKHPGNYTSTVVELLKIVGEKFNSSTTFITYIILDAAVCVIRKDLINKTDDKKMTQDFQKIAKVFEPIYEKYCSLEEENKKLRRSKLHDIINRFHKNLNRYGLYD